MQCRGLHQGKYTTHSLCIRSNKPQLFFSMCGTFSVLECRSHKLSGAEQKVGIDPKKDMVDVILRKGYAILFSRQLLHNGTAYDHDHDRFFCFVDIFPKTQDGYIHFLNPNETFLHTQPVTNATRKNRLHSLAKREVRKTGEVQWSVLDKNYTLVHI